MTDRRALRRWLRTKDSPKAVSATQRVATPSAPTPAVLREVEAAHRPIPYDEDEPLEGYGSDDDLVSVSFQVLERADADSTLVDVAFRVQTYGQSHAEAGPAYGQVHRHYPGQFGTSDGWQGDRERGVAAHPTDAPDDESERLSYFSEQQMRPTDHQLEWRIRRVLGERWVDAANVGFRVSDGQVTLRGLVSTPHEQRLVIDLLEQVPGVVSVDGSALRCASTDGPQSHSEASGAGEH